MSRVGFIQSEKRYKSNLIYKTKVEKMLEKEVTKENLNKMVVLFYTKVLKDSVVAPFFIQRLGDDLKNEKWRPHLELLTNFWASIALGDSAYRGSPFAPHLDIQGISREAFQGWLRLFYETQDSVYTPEIADFFKNRSTLIAGNFMRNLGV